jgi:hypothetical protein
MTSKKTFKPRPSTGWAWVGAIGFVLLATGLNLLITSGLSGPFMLTILLTIPIGLAFLLIAVFFPAMRYEIEGSYLTLTYGPILRYTIDIDQIKSIRRRDLRINLLSSFRFPGLALFSVPYLEIGRFTNQDCRLAHGCIPDVLIQERNFSPSVTPHARRY